MKCIGKTPYFELFDKLRKYGACGNHIRRLRVNRAFQLTLPVGLLQHICDGICAHSFTNAAVDSQLCLAICEPE